MGVTMFDFLSDKLGYHTKLYVILPGCVNQGKKPAGTLYLLHGGGGNSQDWIRFSSIERYAEEKNDVVSLCWGSLEELAGTDSDSKVWIDRASETGEYPALFGAIGTEDGGYAHAQKYLAYCKEKNVKIYYEEMPGGHEWKVWDTMIVKYLDWIQTL